MVRSPEEILFPLAYRPGEHDDWGTVRDADGHRVLRISVPLLDENVLGRHRRDHTDPVEEIGQYVVNLLNMANESLQGKGEDR